MQTLRNKNSKKVLLILSIITSSFFYSCTKIDTRPNELPINNEEITNRFFATTAKTDPINFRIIEELKKINNRQEFITAFAKENGYPVWDKTIISFKKKNINSFSVNNVNGQNDTTIIIPLVLANSQFVNAYIAADLNDSINANLFKAKDYKNCPFKTTTNNDTSATAEKLAFRMIYLDFHVFGLTDFDITDNRLFAFLKNTNTSQTPLTRRIKNITLVNNFGPAVCFEYSYEEVYSNPFGVICPNGSACQWTHTVVQSTCIYFGDPMPHTITYTIPTYNSGTNTNPNSSGGTGGSGTPIGWNPIPINPAITYTLSTLGADIDGIEIVWFRASNHYLQAIEIQNYLIQNNNSPAAIALCWLHLNLMISDPIYFNFVACRPNNIKTAYYSYLTEVENNLINPCLKSIINDIKAEGHKSIVFDLYKRAQSVPDFKIKFKYEEVVSLPNNAPANTTEAYNQNSQGLPTSGIMTIQLNKTALIGKSKEYITSVVLHEICHAIIKSSNALNSNAPLTQEQEHTRMILIGGYPIKIYTALKELYPNPSNATAAQIAVKDSDFKDLSIGGLADVLFDTNGILLNNALTSLIGSSNYFPSIDITNAYYNTIPAYKNLTKGTICN